MPHLSRNALLLLLSSTPALSLHAQSPATGQTGSLRIMVKDPANRPVAKARGVLYGSSGDRHLVETASDGSLAVSDLALGRYTLVLSSAGFAPVTLHFSLTSAAPVTRDVTLLIGSVNTSVSVIASTPAGSLDIPLSDVPATVQTVSAKTIEDTNAINLTEVLKRRLNGVYVNENQDNPFQPDVNYRGYTASPLVGSPAGLSVYLDGVRQNQPFGDVVQWDLIPKVAIATTELIPGSDPVYGLNTLGGAIAVQTKDGIVNSGFSVSAYGGSWGRRAVDAEYGGSKGPWNWFAAGTLFHEDGWRQFSPSSVKQSFAKVGYAANNTVVSVSGGYAINNLTGNGTQDIRAIQRTVGLNNGYNSVYTIPDVTYQHSPFLTVNLTQSFGHGLSLNVNSYVRYLRTNTSNGDANDDAFTESLYTLSTTDKTYLTKAGIAYPTTAITAANTPFPYLRCIAASLALNAGVTSAEPAEKCDGVDTFSYTKQHSYGLTSVLAWNAGHNKFAIGSGFDRGGLTFVNNSQWGYINSDGHSITTVPSFDDGSELNDDGYLDDDRVNLHGTTTTPSFFITDTFSWNKWVFNAGGRYNHTTINNVDRLPKAASGREGLTAVNSFQRFNPTAGVVYKASAKLHAFFDYGESSRAPTSTELGCADPNYPCSLPNALVSDPALQQVVARTFEFGFRGNPDGRFRWSADYFHAMNYNDLLFIASPQTGFGYFTNFGKTRREGLEVAASAHLHNLDAGIDYTFLDATYQSAQTIESGSNSSNTNATGGEPGVTDGGNINIVPGNHIPQVPQHMMKIYTDYHPLRKLGISADFNLISAAYVRGNENNQTQIVAPYYLGMGKSPGYGIVNLGSRYTISSHFELFAEINNVLNRHYYTAGQLSDTPYDNNGNFIAREFTPYKSGDYPIRNTTYLAPGAPFGAFGGLKVTFGKR
jgi:outer membrane receptor protein involved in Fe transport